MTIRYLSLLALLPAVSVAQSWQFQGAAGRPLLHLVREFRDHYGWLVTYEEGPCVGANVRVSTDNGLLMPAADPMLFAVGPSANASTPKEYSLDQRAAAIENVLTQHNRTFRMGAFCGVRNGPYIHILPNLWSNDGTARGYTSLLQTPVTLKPIANYSTITAALDDIVGQVAKAQGVSISVGVIPNNIFLPQRPLFDIKAEVSARDALIALFEQANLTFPSPREDTFAWELLYDPNSKGFLFNVVRVPVER